MDILEKLSVILDHEFKSTKKRVRDYESSYNRIFIHLKDIKEDVDVDEFIYQLKKNIAYDAMRKIDDTHYEVKELIKKQKVDLNEEPGRSYPFGICKCSKEFIQLENKPIEGN